MRTKKHIAFSIIICLAFACSENKNKEFESEVPTVNHTRSIYPETENSTVTDSSKTIFSSMPDPIKIIDLDEIKMLDWNCGVAKVESNFCYPIDGGHYGFYTFIDKRSGAKLHRDTTSHFAGHLLIYRQISDKIWTVNDTTQKFQSIELTSDIISIWDDIKVGIGKQVLLNFIGDSFHYQKGSILHTELPGYTGDFTIIDDTIRKIHITKVCD